MIRHEVADFDAWKPNFDGDDGTRIEYGQQGHSLFRDQDDPNTVVMVGEFDSLEQARSFVELEELRDIMAEAGVQGEPEISFLDLVEQRSAPQTSA